MKIKSFVAGFLAGLMVATSVTAFGLVLGSGRVDAYLQDTNASIIVDGKYLDLGDDYHILNYNDRTYTPARLIAESLGATVTWEDFRKAVVIESPEPEVIVKYETVEIPTASYTPLPQRRTRNNMMLHLTDYYKYSRSDFTLYFEYRNDSGSVAIIKVRDAYIEGDGVKYDYRASNNNLETDSIPEGRLVENAHINFETLPDDLENIKVVIPVELRGYDDSNTTLKYEFYVELD